MDIKTLSEALRREKASPYLQELGRDFYREAGELFRSMLAECRRIRDLSQLSMKLAEVENIKNMISDIYETRERKIVSSALYYVKSGEEVEVENLTKEEEQLLEEIIRTLKAGRERVLAGFEGEMGDTQQEEMEEREEAEKEAPVKERGVRFVTVRILRDLPSLVGVDGRVYGEFKAEDVVTLPEPNARILIERGDAEAILIERS
ncbi:MAG: DNA replication complex GINS family protein [Euryarchaeota archaeon]|nr:DNA replication complex GINS family protein [Euryarchaeota archaeon]